MISYYYWKVCPQLYFEVYRHLFFLGMPTTFLFGMPKYLLFLRSRCLTEYVLVDTLTGTEGIRRETLLSFLESMLFNMTTSFFDTTRSLTMLTNESLFCNNSSANELLIKQLRIMKTGREETLLDIILE